MATLTPEKAADFKRQLLAIQDRLNQIKQVAGGTTVTNTANAQPLNPAQIGGASGRGFESTENQNIISEQVKAVTEAGGSVSQAGDPVPRLSREQAASLGRSLGLEGIVDPSQFAGLTYGEAAARAARERAARTGQVSANTSFAFNPETLKRTQRAVDKFGFALDEVENDPFEPKEFKDQNKQNAIETAQREIASFFESPQDFLQAAQTNPAFQDALKKLTDNGGSIDGVAKNISSTITGQNVQDPASYLAGIRNPQANQEAERLAIEELAPESAVAQAEIARVAQIPSDIQRLYFGDERSIGILEMRQKQAEEEIRIIEEQERDASRTARERSNLVVDKARAEMKQQKAKIEENRLRAKNYMTAQLAKLGALKTTGAAPQALQTLETKYEMQVSQLETSYDFFTREQQIGLDETLDAIENQTDQKILGIQEDLTLDFEKVSKEVLKQQQAAEKEIYKITEQYARRLRERTAKHTADLKKAAEKYAKEFAKSVSGVDTSGLESIAGGAAREGDYVPGKGVLLPNGKFSFIDLTPANERDVASANLSGASTVKYFVSLGAPEKRAVIEAAQVGGENFNSTKKLADFIARWREENNNDDSDDEEDIF